MVPDEVRFGRQSISSIRTGTVPAAAAVFIPAAQNRVSLVISTHNATRFTLGTDSNVTAGNGISMPPNTQPLRLNIRDHGDIVQKGIFAISDAGTLTIGYLEVINEET